ncbi:FKBP-type peptidyl-prolyl cis-trans isomerase [Olivibacter sp. CPCC 100613]|uniref:FKBP-type peptidyl-prolyl cis-trans isomerase n=1 Tax=Olivibacter sp. CPCC 100613 TaxID=3079931 RepID=UPI002FF91468
MKHTNKILFLLFGAVIAFSACNKTDFDELQREQERQDSIERVRIEKLIAEQTPLLKAYVEDKWENPIRDTTTGIWFEILAPGQQDSYTYKRNSMGQIVAPTIEVKYKGQLLNGTIFGETSEESANNKTLKINLADQSRDIVVLAWHSAFLPKEIPYNGQNHRTGGLTANGLKKGSKIRFATPSPWGYDTRSRDKIPANSPLVFEIEVVNISDEV